MSELAGAGASPPLSVRLAEGASWVVAVVMPALTVLLLLAMVTGAFIAAILWSMIAISVGLAAVAALVANHLLLRRRGYALSRQGRKVALVIVAILAAEGLIVVFFPWNKNF